MDNPYKALVLISTLLSIYLYLSTSNSHLPSHESFIRHLSQTTMQQVADTSDPAPTTEDNTEPSSLGDDTIASAFRELQILSFTGEWKSDRTGKPFNSFLSDSGKIRMKFFTEFLIPNWYVYEPKYTAIQLIIIDGEYYDNEFYIIKLNDTVQNAINNKTMMYSMQDQVVNISQYYNLELQQMNECNVSIEADLSKIISENTNNLQIKDRYLIIEEAPIQIHVKSTTCNFDFSFSVSKDETVRRIEKTMKKRQSTTPFY